MNYFSNRKICDMLVCFILQHINDPKTGEMCWVHVQKYDNLIELCLGIWKTYSCNLQRKKMGTGNKCKGENKENLVMQIVLASSHHIEETTVVALCILKCKFHPYRDWLCTIFIFKNCEKLFLEKYVLLLYLIYTRAIINYLVALWKLQKVQ